jgi:hypothetical protein
MAKTVSKLSQCFCLPVFNFTHSLAIFDQTRVVAISQKNLIIRCFYEMLGAKLLSELQFKNCQA